MSDRVPALTTLSRRLCPWLTQAYRRLEAARGEHRFGHGWLLAGPAGIGKINLALVMAERLLAGERGDDPELLTAADAALTLAERHAPSDHRPDLYWVFPEEDRRTISVEQIRTVSRELGLKSLRGGAKVVVIEPAEAMTLAAANALLKTLEEPTPETYLWLVSHQPGRLPATVRSRCQLLALGCPPACEALAWLEVALDAGPRRRLLAAAGGAPLRALALFEKNFHSVSNTLEEKLIQVSENKLDPQKVADEWLKMDLELALDWLIRRLQLAIRARLAPEASNPITDSGGAPLHNAWQLLTLRNLFSQLRAAELLLERLGGGTNAELALRVLLLGFQSRG